jgi:hypothetical protein
MHPLAFSSAWLGLLLLAMQAMGAALGDSSTSGMVAPAGDHQSPAPDRPDIDPDPAGILGPVKQRTWYVPQPSIPPANLVGPRPLHSELANLSSGCHYKKTSN